MEIVPWRPFGGELSSFRTEMDRLRKQFFGEAPVVRPFAEEWSPTIDISETKDNLLIKAELPGLEAKDVNVSISGDLLIIKGEKEKEEEEEDEHYHCIERCYGSFQRSFRLPVNVQADKVEAAFDKGVLKITLPKVEEAKNKETAIKINKCVSALPRLYFKYLSFQCG